MRPVRIRFFRIQFLLRATFKLMLATALVGALAGALAMAFVVPEARVVVGDSVLDPPLAIVVATLTGAFCGMLFGLALLLVAVIVGIMLPVTLALVLVVLAFACAATVLCVVGSVALAFSPFLLLGLGCVLLFRAQSRRGFVPEPANYPPTQ